MFLSTKTLSSFARGFTLPETLVGIFVITIAIAAAMTAVQSGLTASYFARDQITAFYLAEDAIEYIRNKRDTNSLKVPADPWLEGLGTIDPATLCFSGNGCVVDTVNGTDPIACAGTCPPLQYNPTSGFYHQNSSDAGSTVSKYTRKVKITEIGSGESEGDEVLITVTMSWKPSSFSTRTFEVKELMYNWHQQ